MFKNTFLVEIGTEELPPKALRKLAKAFTTNVIIALDNSGLTHGNVEWFASPRRLALKVKNLATFQLDREIKKRGPSVSQAFDKEGKPSKAAKGWAKNCGITVDQSERLITDKGEWLMHFSRVKGKSAEVLLPNIIASALENLPIPKLMRWGSSDVHFVRPVRTVTLLLGNSVIPATILGVKSDRVIRGHRFMGEVEFSIDNADQYPQVLLERGKVIADYEQRKEKIKKDAEEAAQKIGGKVDLSDDLLEEVTSLVEWPVILTAKFEEKFLNVPVEALVHTMKTDQKYFPVYGNNGKLLPNFIFVANIESKDPNQIIFGNEKVVRPRLADAEFFFKIDCKRRLEDNLPRLKNILFQNRLGTLREKTDRIVELSAWIARKIGANINHAMRAGLLSKCDLMSSMVFEFVDIQGIMGMHYARHDGEAEDVALALSEQYQPRFFGDSLPSNTVSCAVAIADKIDTLSGIFGVGQYPKSNKDPFGLRRAALGVLRIIIEKNLKLDLRTLIEKAVQLYTDKLINKNVVDDVVNFMFGRLRAWYQKKGYSIDTIQAVLARRPTYPLDFDARIRAVLAFRSWKEASKILLTNKRIFNILSKTSEPLNNIVDTTVLKETAEIDLAINLLVLEDKLQSYIFERCYQEALIELSPFCDLLNNFLETVMINVEEKDVRINRLTLLAKFRKLFLQVADLSLLQ